MLQHTATMLHYQIIKSPGILNNSLFITHRSDLLLAISWKRLTMWSPADAQNSLTKSNDHCNLCINKLDTVITKVRDKMLQLATIICKLYKKLNSSQIMMSISRKHSHTCSEFSIGLLLHQSLNSINILQRKELQLP